MDDILHIITWSLRCLASGYMPSARHDGAAWTSADFKRHKFAGRFLGVQGVLAEIRGDWLMFKSTLRLPAHNEVAGCCWRCAATPPGIRDCGLAAAWRQQALSHWDLCQRVLSQGLTLSPLFAAPAFRSSCILLDWLHCVDLGVAADFLGNLFWLCHSKLPGNSREEQNKALWALILDYYKIRKPDSMYDGWTLKMVRKTGTCPPKLRGRAGEVRGLVPFGLALAEELLQDADPVEATVKQMARLLAECYNSLAAASFDPEKLAEHSRRFCLLWVGMEARQPGLLWHIKPKLHLFQHLCESGSRPSSCWTYRDEDFGGSMARLGRRRGGKNTPQSTAKAVLLRFFAKHKLPVL
jgi:hypothetical protein